MRNKRHMLRVIISGGVLIVLSFSLLAVALPQMAFGLPWLANHFGFALPGLRGLPYRVAYAGRLYSNTATCAYADWCQSASQSSPARPLCESKEDMQREKAWPLVPVRTIVTFIGFPHLLTIPQSEVSQKFTPLVIYVAYSTDCYVSYALEGGP